MLTFLGFRKDLFSEIRSPAELNSCSLGTLVAVIGECAFDEFGQVSIYR